MFIFNLKNTLEVRFVVVICLAYIIHTTHPMTLQNLKNNNKVKYLQQIILNK